MGNVVITDNTEAVIAEMKRRVAIALEMVGGEAEANVADLTPVKTSALRNSITHKVSQNKVTIGTNVHYAP